MTHRIRLALVAGVFALTLTGCERNPSDLAGPSLARAPNIPGAAATPSRADTAATRAAGSLIPLADAFAGSSWYDGDGHHYEIRYGTEEGGNAGRILHYRDGELFADVAPEAQGGQTAFYSGGELIHASAPQWGPAATRAIGDGAGLLPEPHSAGARPFNPRGMMAFPCQDEINAYIVSSGELIAAGLYLQRNRASRRAITTFAAAVANWSAAWRSLYLCMGA